MVTDAQVRRLKRLSKTEKTKVKVDSGSIIYADRNAYTVNSRLQRPRSPRSTPAATVSSAVPSQRQAMPTKRRILLKFYVEWAPAPTARSVRGSSRPIMSMRFRPANIRVINRRASSSAVIRPAVPQEKAGFPLCRGKPALISNRQTSGLDRSLHIRS